MNKAFLVFIGGVVIFFVGCGTAAKKIAERSISEREDVFHEIHEGEALQEGAVDLTVKAQIKTHLKGWYLLESKNSLQGKPTYPFLLNIDGQAVTWQVTGQKERDIEYDGCVKNHDCGEGMRYILEENIRLNPGIHKIFFGLPGYNYGTEFEMTLSKGEIYNLELKPIYRRQNYLKGIVRFDVFLNNTKVKQESGCRRPLLDW